MQFTPRLTHLFIVAYTAVMMATAVFYFQEYLGYEPCVLCVAQRIATIAVGAFALVGFIHGGWHKFYSVMVTLAAGLGIAVAGRHIWIQNLPAEDVPACGPSFEYIVDVFPWREALDMILMGDGNCADLHWSFLGLSIPGWTLVAFIGLFALGVWQVVRKS